MKMTGAGDDANLQPWVMLQLAFAVINIFHRNEFILVATNMITGIRKRLYPGIELFSSLKVNDLVVRRAERWHENLSGEYVNA